MKSFPRKNLAISCESVGSLGMTHLVPESNISRTIVDDRSELGVALQVAHEIFHSVDTVDEIDDSLLFRFLVKSLPDVIDGLAENGRKSGTHRGLGVSATRNSDGKNLRGQTSTRGILGLGISMVLFLWC